MKAGKGGTPMEKPSIVFFGTTDFAAAVMQTLIEENYPVIAAVTQPDRPVGRKKVIVRTPVAALADQHDIAVLQPEKLSKEADSVLSLEPDLIVTCAYGQFIPSVILNAPKLGCVNVHPSLLPKYRGGAPVQRAVMNGDSETGVCLMEMTKRMDAGRIWACTKTGIGEDETSSDLFERLCEISCRMIREYLPLYIEGKLEGIPQDEEKVVLALNIDREEERIVFADEDITDLYNHLRGLLDEPGGYGMINAKRIKFLKVRREITDCTEKPGTVLGFADHAMRIAAKGGILKVYELQPEGKSRMSADAFANGAGRNLIGAAFE